MKAVICTKYGAADVLQLADIPKPSPKDNQVLIKIHATTVHVGDIRIRSFDVPRWSWPLARLALGLFRPRNPVLGMECAGTIETVGQDVTRFKVGDAVMASLFPASKQFGGYAEYKCLQESDLIVHKPDNISFEEAAAVPAGGLTVMVLFNQANSQPGQEILIYGASGSVGTYAVQIAKARGAKVTGVCSTRNLDLVASLGADRVIDYTRQDFVTLDQKYDLILDAVDKLKPEYGKQALKPQGIYLNVSKDSGSPKDVKQAYLDELRELIEAGKLKVVIDRCYPLDEIVEAHRYVEQGHKRGNVIVTILPNT
ncbi:MAG: NAD(P)-dependent alcohol dehydrogenase [Anaerolineaceae bacterium]|nr:NAD(P)-dependent alcohol dehydrogenase [Anaerolineaceae bacterium]